MSDREAARERDPLWSGPQLRGLIAERGLTRRAVAARLGISERRLRVILREARPCDPGRVLRAIAAFDPAEKTP